jgi:hypothetical protein
MNEQLFVPKFLRRRQAAQYLTEKYGFGSERTLAKLACIGGGPEFRTAGRIPLYEQGSLDAWAQAKIGPLRKSTSDVGQKGVN